MESEAMNHDTEYEMLTYAIRAENTVLILQYSLFSFLSNAPMKSIIFYSYFGIAIATKVLNGRSEHQKTDSYQARPTQITKKNLES